ncbi:MAG TPA: 3-isopropylmalate dehydratase large subunit [Thermodesulfobacteriota bacterium]|nr:3-isopropylmalate dehydratase large subunit [Thermodesulfobacteriota bacterium]
MGMTITEKILAAHAGRKVVEPGEIVQCKIDVAMGNDITAPIAIKAMRQYGLTDVFDPQRVMLVMSHFAPNKDIASAEQVKLTQQFAREKNLPFFFSPGIGGIEHVLLPSEGLVVPGDVMLGADSHTCTAGAIGAFATGVGSTDLAAALITGETWFRVPESMKFVYYGQRPKWVYGKDLILTVIGDIGVDGALYRAMEHTGPAIAQLAMHERFTLCNMAIEAGGKNGIINPDEVTRAWVEPRAKRQPVYYQSDPDAKYVDVREYDLSKLEPVVAKPMSPENTAFVSEVAGVPVDQVFIGSCTNGWLEDMRIAASILKGKKVHPYTRTIIIPATQEIYRAALKEGLIEIFTEAGAVVSTSTCGPCLGGYMGVLAKDEVCLSTSNRNFRGRMGHPDAKVYLANPAVAAATAVKGKIAHPEEVA